MVLKCGKGSEWQRASLALISSVVRVPPIVLEKLLVDF